MAKQIHVLLKTVAQSIDAKYCEDLIVFLGTDDARIIDQTWQVLPSRVYGPCPGHLLRARLFTAVNGAPVNEVKRLLKEESEYVIRYQAWRFTNPTKYEQLRDASKNFQAVLGEEPDLRLLVASNNYKSWLGVKSGRDLFIKGLGTFDISVAYDAIRVGYHITTPEMLQARGYLDNHYIRCLGNKRSRALVIKHWNWVRLNRARADELCWIVEGNFDRTHPDAHIETLIELAEAHMRAGGKYGYNPETKFDWLESYKPLEDFDVLRTVAEVYSVGESLKNCIGSYISKVANKKQILAVLKKGGRDYAVGNLNRQGSWEQIRLSCNQEAPADVRKIFVGQTKKLLKLWKE